MKLDHLIVILIAFIFALGFYAALLIVTGDNPRFIEAAIVGLAGALAGLAKN